MLTLTSRVQVPVKLLSQPVIFCYSQNAVYYSLCRERRKQSRILKTGQNLHTTINPH